MTWHTKGRRDLSPPPLLRFLPPACARLLSSAGDRESHTRLPRPPGHAALLAAARARAPGGSDVIPKRRRRRCCRRSCRAQARAARRRVRHGWCVGVPPARACAAAAGRLRCKHACSAVKLRTPRFGATCGFACTAGADAALLAQARWWRACWTLRKCTAAVRASALLTSAHARTTCHARTQRMRWRRQLAHLHCAPAPAAAAPLR
jgi:hypothetical protein